MIDLNERFILRCRLMISHQMSCFQLSFLTVKAIFLRNNSPDDFSINHQKQDHDLRTSNALSHF